MARHPNPHPNFAHDWRTQLERRFDGPPLSYGEIAELHAVAELGARWPDGPPDMRRPGFDVLVGEARIEIKSKEMRGRSPASRTIELSAAKTGCDRFWFYLFYEASRRFDVWEMPTPLVFACARRKGKRIAIDMDEVVRHGRRLWPVTP